MFSSVYISISVPPFFSSDAACGGKASFDQMHFCIEGLIIDWPPRLFMHYRLWTEERGLFHGNPGRESAVIFCRLLRMPLWPPQPTSTRVGEDIKKSPRGAAGEQQQHPHTNFVFFLFATTTGWSILSHNYRSGTKGSPVVRTSCITRFGLMTWEVCAPR